MSRADTPCTESLVFLCRNAYWSNLLVILLDAGEIKSCLPGDNQANSPATYREHLSHFRSLPMAFSRQVLTKRVVRRLTSPSGIERKLGEELPNLSNDKSQLGLPVHQDWQAHLLKHQALGWSKVDTASQ